MKFSMILPVHNGAGCMRKMLDSIAAQSFKDYEMIVVCDACTDDSYEIALDYAENWPGEHGMIVEDVGFGNVGMARNHGLSLAQGDWVLFADDDDWLLHEYVFALLAAMAGTHDEDILACSFVWKGVGYFTPAPDNFNPAVWNKAWWWEFIGDTRFSAKQYGDDLDFANAMLAKKPRIIFWDMPIYYYNYLRKDSISERLQRGEKL